MKMDVLQTVHMERMRTGHKKRPDGSVNTGMG